MGATSWISPTKYFTAFFIANFTSTQQFGSSDWVMQSVSSSQSSSSANLLVLWVVKSESDISESASYSSVTCFEFLPAFWIESHTLSSLGSKILNMFLLKCNVRILNFFSLIHHFYLHWVQLQDMDRTVLESLSFPKRCLLVPLMMSPTLLTVVLEQRVY